MPLGPEEDIVRAICSDKYDGQRFAPSLFRGANTSVSRLAITSLEDHWELFRRTVQKPPVRTLKLIGEISVAGLQQVGQKYEPQVALSVEPKPEPWNPAHAEIPEKISTGLANKIIAALKYHSPPNTILPPAAQ